jgi:hypothetical protein
VTFVLTSGGHNAGIVSEPGHKGRYYRISLIKDDIAGFRIARLTPKYIDPETWYETDKDRRGIVVAGLAVLVGARITEDDMMDQSKLEQSGGSALQFILQNVTETAQMQTRTFLDQQVELFNETQKAMAAWMKRRREGTSAGTRIFLAMCGGKDAGTITTLYREWLTGGMGRVFADMNAARHQSLRLAEISQKSLMALSQHSADTVSSTTGAAAASSVIEKETRGTKGAPRTEAA